MAKETVPYGPRRPGSSWQTITLKTAHWKRRPDIMKIDCVVSEIEQLQRFVDIMQTDIDSKMKRIRLLEKQLDRLREKFPKRWATLRRILKKPQDTK